jgi:hypothetical protein
VTGQTADPYSRITINRLRGFVDSRVALLASRVPQAEVIAPQNTVEAIDGARTAEALVEYEWDDVGGWNIGRFVRRAMLEAEQDGIVMGSVLYDRTIGPMCQEMIDTQTGEPLSSYDQVRAAIEQDPNGGNLWMPRFYPCGDVVFRVVRCGTMSFDPAWQEDWKECKWVIEHRRRSIDEIERLLGAPIETLLGDKWRKETSKAALQQTVDEGGGRQRTIDTRYEVVTHELFAIASPDSGEWPQGAHVLWIDGHEKTPLVEEPWMWPSGDSRGLPYFPLIVRPDGGDPMESKGTTEELLPIAIDMHRRLKQYADWMELVAKPMMVLNGAVMRSPSLFNAERVVETTAGASDPHFMSVPPDPAQGLLQILQYYEEQMAEVAEVRAATRGNAPGHGVQAASAITALIGQDEQNLSDTEAELREFMEWAVGEALRNVTHFFSIPRILTLPGIEDEASFEAFTGATTQGADRWKVVEPLQPKSKAVRQQMLMQFLQYAGDRFDATPFMKEFVEGDVDTITRSINAHVRKQEWENRMLATIGSRPDVEQLWQNFQMMRNAYIQQMHELEGELQQRYLETGTWVDAQSVAAQLGIKAPRILDMLRQVGVRIPQVENMTDRHILHCTAMERRMAGTGFQSYHEAVKQSFREHFQEHVEAEARGAKAIASQTLPQAAEATPGAQPPTPPPGSSESSDAIDQGQQQTEGAPSYAG